MAAVGEVPCEGENKQPANLLGWGRAGGSLSRRMGPVGKHSSVPLGAGCPPEGPPHTPSSPAPRVGENRDGKHQGERGRQRWGDLGSATSAQRVWMCEALRAKALTPLIPHPKSSKHSLSPIPTGTSGGTPSLMCGCSQTLFIPLMGRSLHFTAETSVGLVMGLCTHMVLPFKNGAFCVLYTWRPKETNTTCEPVLGKVW